MQNVFWMIREMPVNNITIFFNQAKLYFTLYFVIKCLSILVRSLILQAL